MKASLVLLALSLSMSLLVCCEGNNNNIDVAYALVEDNPDSALLVLNRINKVKLGKKDRAKYALVYSIAQDKMGVDVDNDSLLSIAYAYYGSREKDSLYSKCQYYMGKYYALNDMTEDAIACFNRAVKASEAQHDKYTLCLSLEKLSRLMRQTNPQQAVRLAGKAVSVYASTTHVNTTNMAYYRLNLCIALLLNGNKGEALTECTKALALALALKDSSAISDCFQDMVLILKHEGEYDKALESAKQSCRMVNNADAYKLLNLATAYLDADSLAACDDVLDKILSTDYSIKYNVFYLRHLLALKSGDIKKSQLYADSAFHYQEQMLGEELSRNHKYYKGMLQAQYDKGQSDDKAKNSLLLLVVSVLAGFIVSLLIFYSYKQYKKQIQIKMAADAEIQNLRMKVQEEKLHHREKEIAAMRNFIMRKVDVFQKIEQLKATKKKARPLTESDWEEIEDFVNSVDGGFVERLKYRFPQLTESDFRLLILLRLKMPAKALSLIYGINEKSIKQKLFVFKSKVNIVGEKTSLRNFIENF